MTLLRAANLRLTFGSRTIFDGLTLTVEEGERVGLVGVNGSGKSSLLRILAGEMPPDSGDRQLRRGARVMVLPQEPTFPEGATVASELSVARGELREALREHEELAGTMEGEDELHRLAQLSDRIEQLGGWDTAHEARTLLGRFGVEAWDQPLDELSGGNRKRVAVVRALLARPDLLLLDEPTNHLDADTVDTLEEELDRLSSSIVLVTHDRYFLDDLVDRILEIEPGAGVRSYPGNYEAYLTQKQEEEELSGRASHKRSRWIAQEVAWLRKGVEARRTKSRARITRARKLMAERGYKPQRTAALQIAEVPRSSQKVLEAEGVGKRFGDRQVLSGVDLILQEGERIGIVGRNGAGKTTLLRVLLGELPPDEGKVELGPRTRIAYHDQERASLDPEATVYKAAWDEEQVTIGGRQVPLKDFLEDLLFPAPMQRMQVKALSGGERNRLLLARLFLSGSNLLVLDEPTNDLDIVTLNVLEKLLTEFTGSVLLVTHDRWFLDKVATSILALEGDGRAVRYEGNYETYRTLRDQAARPAAAARGSAPAPPPARAAPAARKLSFAEQRELQGMEAAVEAAERHRAELEERLGSPDAYQLGSALPALTAELEAARSKVDRLWARWQELQARVIGSPP